MKLLLLFFSLLLATSCSDDSKYTKEELYKTAIQVDPKLELVLPKDLASGIPTTVYGEGCLRVIQVKHNGLIFILAEYETPQQAKIFGKSIRSFVLRNWVIDDALGEPILERFIRKAFPDVRLAQDIPLSELE